MKPKELLSKLRRLGCAREEGKRHTKVTCGVCKATVPRHVRDLGVGLLAAIEKQLTPCLGDNWMENDG